MSITGNQDSYKATFFSSFMFKVNSAIAINFSYHYKSEKNQLKLSHLPCVLSTPEYQEGKVIVLFIILLSEPGILLSRHHAC